LLASGRWILPAHFPPEMNAAQRPSPYFDSGEGLSLKKASKRLQRDLIEKALKQTGGNRTQAAKLLEISRPMLISRIKEYGLEL
ncbi:MAG: sigma-54-dependent Fis family transcriptional regulator, partial [Deltaproteobacteria bacterium]|nr:sigma-54-dependent Fis family transcriptional regulator [Deltaproteobacteria bacterium]